MKPVKTFFTLLFFQYLIVLFSGIFTLTDMWLYSAEAERHAALSMDRSELCTCQCDLGDADHECTCDNHHGRGQAPAAGPVWLDGFVCGSSVSFVPAEISSKYTLPVESDIPVFFSIHDFVSETPLYKGSINKALFRPPQHLS